jgi:hypothetical protein
MATDTDRLIQEIRSLAPEDRQRLQEALAAETRDDIPLLFSGQRADEAYQERLVQAGLLREVRPRHRDQQAFERFRPVEIVGKPLSETIIEERR